MIAYQRESAAGKLDADLVAATGVQTDTDQTGFPLGQPIERKSGLFHTFTLPLHHKHFVLLAVFPQ